MFKRILKRRESLVRGEFEILDVTNVRTATGVYQDSSESIVVHTEVWLRIKSPCTRNSVYRACGQYLFVRGRHSTFEDACPWRCGMTIPRDFVVSRPVGLFRWFRTAYVRPNGSWNPFLSGQSGEILNLEDWWESVLVS